MLFFITDVIIISVSGIVFQDLDVALYAGIIAVVNSFVSKIAFITFPENLRCARNNHECLGVFFPDDS